MLFDEVGRIFVTLHIISFSAIKNNGIEKGKNSKKSKYIIRSLLENESLSN